MADTRIRLGHIGREAYSWEEAGSDVQRYDTYTYHLHGPDKPAQTPEGDAVEAFRQ